MRLPRHFPVLIKELHERANRRRTYVVRVLYAGITFALFTLFYWPIARLGGAGGWGAFGAGKMLFQAMVFMQFAGLFAFLPALTSGVVSVEKERGTLGLLMITDLRPREILLQKLTGALLPMACLMLTSLPLLGICYSLGGVSPQDILSAVYVLGLTIVQVGAIALMMSCFSISPVGSFVGTYVVAAAVYILPVVLVAVGDHNNLPILSSYEEEIALALFAPAAYAKWHQTSFLKVFLHTLPVWWSIAVALAFARLFFVTRAFVPQRNLLLRIWRPVDEFMTWLNQEYAHGVVLVKDRDTYPIDDPVGWREVQRKSLSKARYLVRVLVLIEVPVAFLILLMAMGSYGGSQSPVTGLSFMLWLLAGITILGQTVNLIGSERARNTLDVLLTTPMTAKEIIVQKMKGVWRMQAVVMVPFFTVFIGQAWVENGCIEGWGRSLAGDVLWLGVAVAQVFLFLRVLAWLGMTVGLFCRRRFRAIVLALGLTISWCFLPMAMWGISLGVAEAFNLSNLRYLLNMFEDPIAFFAQVVSPFFNVLAVELGEYVELSNDATLAGYAVGLGYHAALLAGIRALCLHFADRGLGRVSPAAATTAVPQGDSPERDA